jgi:hypothetical protein
VSGARLAAALAAALALLGAAAARGELAQQGDLLVSFSANISPHRLPRQSPVPVAIQIGGTVRTTDRSAPPKLTQMNVEINRQGKISTAGLPVCPAARLRAANAPRALAVCGDALVGRGNATTLISLPDQGLFAVNGTLLAFNARFGGRRGILAYVHAERPLPLTYLIRFAIEHNGRGRFGATLSAEIPSIASGQGRISAFNLSLRRTYRFGGDRRSYLMASCPLPEGFTAAPFPLARTTYGFEDGRTISAVLTRECQVRGK